MATPIKRKAAPTPAKKASKTKAEAPPWEREQPKGPHTAHLSTDAKAEAKQRAKNAGRPYPNLVDNMRAAREAKK